MICGIFVDDAIVGSRRQCDIDDMVKTLRKEYELRECVDLR